MRKVKRKLPGGRVVVHLRKPKPRAARCARCGRPLHGVPRLRPVQLRRLPKSKRRPARPYGGYLCSRCTRELFREWVRHGGEEGKAG